MRFLKVLFVCLALIAAAVAKVDLEDPSEIVRVLGNEPAAASEPRFQEVMQTAKIGDAPAFVSPTPDTITFKDSSSSGSSSSGKTDDDNVDTSEFDAQLEKINADIKKLEEAIAEEKECYKRLQGDEARLRALRDQENRVQKEKEKKVLETKLEAQLKDQHDLRHMIDRLKGKANELRRTQNIIQGKILATRKAIHSIDNSGAEDATDEDPADNLVEQLDLMHKQKENDVDRQNKQEKNKIRGFIKNITEAGKKQLEE